MDMTNHNVYEWIAYLEDGTCLLSNEVLFEDLPFDKVISFKLKPLIKEYAPIRISTHKKSFRYFKRYIRDLFTQEIITVFHIIDCGCIYAIQYPQRKYWCFRNIKEFEESL